MDEYEFRDKVLRDISAIRESLARVEERVVHLQDFKRRVQYAQYTGIVAFFTAAANWVIGRL